MNKCEQYCRTIKQMANAGGRGLPEEYQAVEYLWSPASSSAAAYIKTGYIPTQRFKTVVRVQFRQENLVACGSWNGNVVGTVYVSKQMSFGVFGGSQTAAYRGASPTNDNSNYTLIDIVPFTLAEDVTITEDWITPEYSVEKNGATYTATPNNYFPTFNNAEFFLFGRNQIGRLLNKGSMKIYYAKIYDSTNQLARDFIPCYRKSDNKPGMYDLVTNTFYTTAGSGEFTVGNNV